MFITRLFARLFRSVHLQMTKFWPAILPLGFYKMCAVIGLNRASSTSIDSVANTGECRPNRRYLDMQFGGHSLVRRSYTVSAEICLSLVLQDAN